MRAHLDRRMSFAIIAVASVVYMVTYLAIDEFVAGRAMHRLFLPGEQAIPFLPLAAFPYALSYFIPLIAIWKLPDTARLARLLWGMVLMLVVAYTTFLVFPCEFPRPTFRVDSPATWLLAEIYRLDKPYNVFPSMHVAIAWLVWLALRDQVRHRALFLTMVVAISVSTVFVKQHYVVDLLYGGALAPAAWAAAGVVRSKLRSLSSTSSRTAPI